MVAAAAEAVAAALVAAEATDKPHPTTRLEPRADAGAAMLLIHEAKRCWAHFYFETVFKSHIVNRLAVEQCAAT